MKEMKWTKAEEFIYNNKDIVYLWFGTEWCGDCHMMKPIVEEVEKHFSNNGSITFIKVDAEEAGIFRKETKYKVLKVPTHIFIKNSNIKSIMYEYVDKNVLIKEIENLIYEK